MAKNNVAEITGKIVGLLDPLSSEDRQRVVTASLTLLGETWLPASGSGNSKSEESDSRSGESAPPVTGRARTWMKQNELSSDEIQEVFQVSDGEAELLASDVPGKDKREKTRNAYVLAGVAQLLAHESTSFTDKAARALCESVGCYDAGNHTKALKDKGNLFGGSKAKGWTITGPGLKHGAALIKTMVDKTQ